MDDYVRIRKACECGEAGNMTAPNKEVRFKQYNDPKRIKDVDEE